MKIYIETEMKEMPEKCLDFEHRKSCPFSADDDTGIYHYCYISKEYLVDPHDRPSWCPLREKPNLLEPIWWRWKMTNKEKFIKTTNVMLLILVILSPILLGTTIGGTIWASAEIKKELDRWNTEYLDTYLELYTDVADIIAFPSAEEVLEEITPEQLELISEYFPIFVREVEAKLALAEKYSWLIGKEYKEFYTRTLHWCWFADDYFWGE